MEPRPTNVCSATDRAAAGAAEPAPLSEDKAAGLALPRLHLKSLPLSKAAFYMGKMVKGVLFRDARRVRYLP
jgi:hypothetical protein